MNATGFTAVLAGVLNDSANNVSRYCSLGIPKER